MEYAWSRPSGSRKMVGVWEALRVRDFRLLWPARLISQLGTWLLVVAAPAYVFELTGSVAATGLTLAAEFLPPLLLGPIAGVLADRWDRRRVMIAADLLRAAAVAMLLLVDSPGTVWLVYAALIVENVGAVLFNPAAQAHTPAVVGTGSALSSANALNGVTDGAVRLIAAPLGGALFAVAGFAPLVIVDAGTYVVSAILILCTSRRAAVPSATRPRIRAGLAFIRRSPVVRALLLVSTVFLAANACLSALLIPYGMTVLGGSAQIGLVISALGVGFLIGAPVMRALVDRLRPGHLLGASLAATGLGFVALFSSRSLPPALVAAVAIGLTGSITLGATQTTMQRVTPAEVLGRTSAAMFTAEAAATLFGALAGPALAAATSIAWTARASGVTAALCGVLAAVLLSGRPYRPPARE
ncbi:MFS transporter [Actinoplanes sp. NPDC089786]|uniref:MFS transporter n=1 Tax=Actinoplanes sp. NPDC089786 TaxID=3155185 RepID=UPI00341A0B7B